MKVPPKVASSSLECRPKLVFGGIEPRPSGLESDALTTRLPTVPDHKFVTLTQGYRGHFVILKYGLVKSPTPEKTSTEKSRSQLISTQRAVPPGLELTSG
ncbi:hypothetical protein TNCV_3732221 [Trichonephila clavipes]|nr:hypothetical protein TNCV_3732221 [Trichonephila clavipes]